jgi:hypothetical protein
MTHEQVLQEFIRKAANVRTSYIFAFNEKSSCLRPIIEALRTDTHNKSMKLTQFGLIRTTLEHKSPADSAKYKEALDWVQANWPNWAGMAGPKKPDLQGLAQAMALRQAKAVADFHDVSFVAKQTQNYNDGVGVRNFEWKVRFRLTEMPTILQVKVIVKLVSAVAITGAFKERWQRQILSSWNNRAFLVVPTSGIPNQKRLAVVFDIEWKDDTYASPAYVVTVVQPAALPAHPKFVKTGVSQWEEKAPVIVSGSQVGTPHMGQWGADDETAVVHEFGHMIGLPDEYMTLTYNGNPLPASVYNCKAFTTGSLMNNTSAEGRIHLRHYQIIADEYNKWKGIAGAKIVF